MIISGTHRTLAANSSTDFSPGRIAIAIQPLLPGRYRLSITYRNVDIVGSPSHLANLIFILITKLNKFHQIQKGPEGPGGMIPPQIMGPGPALDSKC
jgi:hypothetical protein